MLAGLGRLWSRRELVVALIGRDLRSRYKGSVLGVAWSLLNPIALVAVYTVAFQFVIRIRIPHYPLFLIVGLLPWLFFASALSAAVGSIVDQGALVKKVAFPREVLPIAAVGSQLTHFGLAYFLVVPLVAAAQVGLGAAILLLPALLLLLALFTCGLALALATAQVYLRDSRHLLEVLLQIWFWATPVVYSLSLVPDRLRPVYLLNPLASFVASFRDVILDLSVPDPRRLAALVAISIATFAAGYAVFSRCQPRFAEHV